jgi:1-aminocyclopropane-1-carboxylate deaminase/D-cysteine desulfhydrase-like pyridoxal-dependent ACC family enzyme
LKNRTTTIQEVLGRFPNAQISITPTPIYRLSRLSSHLGYSIYIMREDLTGFTIGGNKNRKLDYLIGDAIAKKANTLITTKASNFSRNAAAAGRVFGFEVHVLLVGEESEQNSASQELFKQFETNLHYIRKDKKDTLTEEYNQLLGDLKKKGKAVYELHPGGSDTIGSLGYINAFNQIVHYSQTSGVHFNKIIHSTGSTATQVGLLLGQCISEYDTTIIGMAAAQKADVQYGKICELALSTANMLSIQFDESRIVVEDKFLGPGYAIPSEEGKRAAKMFATMEGVLLDHVYTGKAAAGLIYYAMNRMFGTKEKVLFIHTGGNSGLFY